MMDKKSCIWVAGHKGMVGSAIIRKLESEGYTNIVTSDARLDDEISTRHVFLSRKIDYVFLCAAKVGGIHANNTYPADFIVQNLKIVTNVVECATKYHVKKLCYLGSSCIYPRDCPQPIKEEYLMTGPLEPTNSPYAVAKIAGIEMCKAYYRQHGLNSIIVMPTNLYGPGDNFHPENSHVLPALIRRFYEAKNFGRSEVVVWGDGNVYREFLHVDDLANACVFLMEKHDYNPKHPIINIGAGYDLQISALVKIVAEVVGFDGTIIWDKTKPNGMFRKLLDRDYIYRLGWRSEIDLKAGIKQVYDWYCKSVKDGTARQ